MREGWKCPVCGRGVSPNEKACDHGGGVTDVRSPWPCNPPVADQVVPHPPQRPRQYDPWSVFPERMRHGVAWAGYAPETHTDNTSGQ